jgi:SAM-dependent methyltransferase
MALSLSHPVLDRSLAPSRKLQLADHAAWRSFYQRAPADDIWHPLPFLDELVMQLQPLSGLPVVDIACGDGGQICGLPADLQVLGIDQSPEALDRARKRTAREGRSMARFAEAFVEAMPLTDASAGGAFLIDILSSFLDPLTILREAHRILAPGAALVVTTFTPADPLARASSAVSAQPVWIDGFINIFYEPDQVVDLLSEAGFSVEHVGCRRDQEAGHPGYRSAVHEHERAIVIGRKFTE